MKIFLLLRFIAQFRHYASKKLANYYMISCAQTLLSGISGLRVVWCDMWDN